MGWRADQEYLDIQRDAYVNLVAGAKLTIFMCIQKQKSKSHLCGPAVSGEVPQITPRHGYRVSRF